MSRLIYQLIVGRIAPVGIIVPVPGCPNGEKCEWIHEVADPSTPDHVIVHRVLTLEVHLPFLILDADINVELLLPHLLNGFRDHPMRFVGIDQDVELRETLCRSDNRLRPAVAELAPGHNE